MELKFKAFYKGKWYRVYRMEWLEDKLEFVSLMDEEGNVKYRTGECPNISSLIPIEEVNLFMFTGYRDKNGKETYGGLDGKNGDIIKITEEIDEETNQIITWVGVVLFLGGSFWFSAKGLHDNCWFQHNSRNIELLGNTLENPKLLNPKTEV